MIEIRSKYGGRVLRQVPGDTLVGVDLAGAHLMGAVLADADLSRANLRGAYLHGAKLEGACLAGADATGADMGDAVLIGACLDEARLSDAGLGGANLQRASLRGANLEGTNFRCAYLREADLTRAILRRTNFSGATLERVIFHQTDVRDCPTLALALGLESSIQLGPAPAGGSTMTDPLGPAMAVAPVLPGDMARSAVREDRVDVPPTTCLLSHASAQTPLADRLVSELTHRGINCRRYCFDLGRRVPGVPEITEALRFEDKVVLVFSRRWLEQRLEVPELCYALRRERQAHTQKLFPVRTDEFLLTAAALELGEQRVRAGLWPENWLASLSGLEMPDFSRWRLPGVLASGVTQLAEGLRRPAAR